MSVGLTQHVSRALTQQSVPCFDTVAFVVLGHSMVVSIDATSPEGRS